MLKCRKWRTAEERNAWRRKIEEAEAQVELKRHRRRRKRRNRIDQLHVPAASSPSALNKMLVKSYSCSGSGETRKTTAASEERTTIFQFHSQYRLSSA
jgi:hypothetical protein